MISKVILAVVDPLLLEARTTYILAVDGRLGVPFIIPVVVFILNPSGSGGLTLKEVAIPKRLIYPISSESPTINTGGFRYSRFDGGLEISTMERLRVVSVVPALLVA